MQVRRIVTGHDAQGTSMFISDDFAPRATDFEDIPGHGIAHLWATNYPPQMSSSQEDLTQLRGSLIPGVGKTSLLAVSFPPDSVMTSPLDPQRALAQLAEALPGLFDCFEAENPGMHRTPTIDYGVLLEGELWLELDNGEERLVHPGDVVIQNGTRHAWRNKSSNPAKAIFFMIGATD